MKHIRAEPRNIPLRWMAIPGPETLHFTCECFSVCLIGAGQDAWKPCVWKLWERPICLLGICRFLQPDLLRRPRLEARDVEVSLQPSATSYIHMNLLSNCAEDSHCFTFVGLQSPCLYRPRVMKNREASDSTASVVAGPSDCGVDTPT